MNSPIRVIVVDDHEIFRNGLKMVIGKIENTRVVGEASNGQEFLDLLKSTPTDIVLMDVEMPFLNGIELAAMDKGKYAKRPHNLNNY